MRWLQRARLPLFVFLGLVLGLLALVGVSSFVAVILSGGLQFGGTNELIEQTYGEYKTALASSSFDPRGASNISVRISSTRDGYDEWWHFTISDSDFEALVTQVAALESGPNEIRFESQSAIPPVNWNAEAEVPPWWTIDGGVTPKAIHWCVDAGGAERHHGWFFLFNSDLQEAWCWHWNHQWSSDECP